MDKAQIVLTTPRSWAGNQRLGTFIVYLDGKRAGALPPQRSLRLECDAGKHRLAARQWWYRSKPFELDVTPDREVRLTVDVIREGWLVRRILVLMVMPWHGVTIQAAD